MRWELERVLSLGLFTENGHHFGRERVADEEGRFKFGSIPSGRFRLIVRDPLNSFCLYARDRRLSLTTQSYEDLETFISECLVRALNHRLRVKLEARDSVTKQAEDWIAEMTRQGLTLTRPFYLLLEDYESTLT